MKRTYIIGLFILLNACNDEPTHSPIENDPVMIDTLFTELTDAVLSPKDTTPFYPSYYCADSSWKVALDIQEGFLMNFSIRYKDKSSFFKDVEMEVPATGGVDHPEPHFINDTTYYIPNLGSSKNGHYEMYIYKNKKYEFKEIVTRRTIKSVPAIVEDVNMVSQEDQQAKPPTITNQIIHSQNSIQFKQMVHHHGDPAIGCSSSQTELTLTIASPADSFYFANNELSQVEVHYHLAGGLYDESSATLLRGFVKGVKQTNNSWLIETDIWLLVTSFPNNKTFEKELKLKEIFN